MAKQTLMWTVLPNGYTDDPKYIRVSYYLTPRLEISPGDAPFLSTFEDFKNWPDTLSAAKFGLNAGVANVNVKINVKQDPLLGSPDKDVWSALFSPNTPVRGYVFNDLSTKKVLSYPAGEIDALIKDLYGSLAVSAQDQLPEVPEFFLKPNWLGFINKTQQHDRKQTINKVDGLREVAGRFSEFINGRLGKGRNWDDNLDLFELFHTPTSKPSVGNYSDLPETDPRKDTKWRTFERNLLPKPEDFKNEIDFHQIISAMGQYRTLLRKLGLVIDLLALVPPELARYKQVEFTLQAEVVLPPPSQDNPRRPGNLDILPKTQTFLDATHFQPVSLRAQLPAQPKPSPVSQIKEDLISNGLLDLDPDKYGLIQVDPDGAMLKLMNFLRTLYQLKIKDFTRIVRPAKFFSNYLTEKALDPVSKEFRKLGAPSLRNAGLMLIRKQRAETLANRFARQKKLFEAGTTPLLYAEDLIRGYRVDVWDHITNKWHSLCLRDATYEGDDGRILAKVQEEGTLQLAATKSPDDYYPDLLCLHEAMLSWTGWSLCAPQPGRTIHHKDPDRPDAPNSTDAQAHEDYVGEPEAEVPAGIKLRSRFTPARGSLPRLRYGRKYRLRARVVDLAGNSLAPTEANIGKPGSCRIETTYSRFDPILPPAIALEMSPENKIVTPPCEGGSMDRMAIRSLNDKPELNQLATNEQANRMVVPARSSVKEAEYHGMFDRNGVVDASFFKTLALKDDSLREIQLPEDSDSEQAKYAVLRAGDEIPYLPDPLAEVVAARITILTEFEAISPIPKTIPPITIMIPLYFGEKKWPDASPFRVVVLEDNSTRTPLFKDRTLYIPLSKGDRAVLSLSVKPSASALKKLGIWEWIEKGISDPKDPNAPLKILALNGRHWMLTPWREIELVHAVQRPLLEPCFEGTVNFKRFSFATHAYPIFQATCSLKSTDHLDVYSHWNVPTEDTSLPDPVINIHHSDHAFTVKLTLPGSYGDTPEYEFIKQANGMDYIKVGQRVRKMHHFNDTRYRRIIYSMDATTSFREFMPKDRLMKNVNGTDEPTDEFIKVSGNSKVAWVPNSAPPPVPDVLYVVPTFGWSRLNTSDSQATIRRGGGLRVYLNRPWNQSGYGEMLGVVLPAEELSAQESNRRDADLVDLKDVVTQWGNDPIWKSKFVTGLAPKRADFCLARNKPDRSRSWLPEGAPTEEADQPPGGFRVTSLEHPDTGLRVEVAPHDIHYDKDRRLWYSDIVIDGAASYFPFIRLALARYQPVSIDGAHLSKSILADFMQLVPDRWLNIYREKDPKVRYIGIYGDSFTDSSGCQEVAGKKKDVFPKPVELAQSSVWEIRVEQCDPGLGDEFGWDDAPGATIVKMTPPSWVKIPEDEKRKAELRARAALLLDQGNYELLVKEKLIDYLEKPPLLWAGKITLPDTGNDHPRLRLSIAEYEEYLVDDANTYQNLLTRKGKRLVFMEYILLN